MTPNIVRTTAVMCRGAPMRPSTGRTRGTRRDRYIKVPSRRAFTLGQSLMPGVNALLLGTLMYRSRLVPRVLPVLGLIGAPLHITAVVLTMFGAVSYTHLRAHETVLDL